MKPNFVLIKKYKYYGFVIMTVIINTLLCSLLYVNGVFGYTYRYKNLIWDFIVENIFNPISIMMFLSFIGLLVRELRKLKKDKDLIDYSMPLDINMFRIIFIIIIGVLLLILIYLIFYQSIGDTSFLIFLDLLFTIPIILQYIFIEKYKMKVSFE